MKIVIAPDSYKGSLTSREVVTAIFSGCQRVAPDAEYVLVPMADGGEGTVESLVTATSGSLKTAQVTNPIGEETTATYGILGDKKTAVIEMAAASGVQYVDRYERNPMHTTTYGTGELIKAALDQGINKIIIGLGGSATNDGGAGMAQALGIHFLDANNQELGPGGAELSKLRRIDMRDMDPRIKSTQFIIASDVKNPLTGKNGASVVFGPQKGATPGMVHELDRALVNYSKVIRQTIHRRVDHIPGSGAAGGLGAGMLAFLNAKIKPGINIVLEYSDFRDKVKYADLVFTGEGKVDFQTKLGKTPFGVAKAAKEVSPNCKVIAIAGTVGKGSKELTDDKIFDALFGTVAGVKPLQIALRDAKVDIARTVENVMRLVR
ncbi:glycerate kinase [Lentilactobacillus sp. Marseille-Q4993]|uniref:glycerate kinase family protein n=1 Tax=Lentilactobacillus sp. Marseille-Q4993 TaxID=3039492 RepID=UPI0024BC2562|nr:glycerate kinase [Lentilactobacillus sp. Marseille-Q4993]